MFRAASEKNLGSLELRNELQLPVHPLTMRATLCDNGNFKYTKMKCVPLLAKYHKRKRFDTTTAHMAFSRLKRSEMIF